jgi:hypothetical protein
VTTVTARRAYHRGYFSIQGGRYEASRLLPTDARKGTANHCTRRGILLKSFFHPISSEPCCSEVDDRHCRWSPDPFNSGTSRPFSQLDRLRVVSQRTINLDCVGCSASPSPVQDQPFRYCALGRIATIELASLPYIKLLLSQSIEY